MVYGSSVFHLLWKQILLELRYLLEEPAVSQKSVGLIL